MRGVLQGRRVLVTRAARQASGLAAALEREGAEAVVLPALESVPPESWCALDAALASLRSFDWLLFTSANGVEAFTARARRLGVSPVPRGVAAVGPATARAVVEAGVAARVDLVPERFVAEGLLESLLPVAGGASMLLVRAAEARDVLVDGLRAAGAEVTVAPAYRTVVPAEGLELARRCFGEGAPRVDAATFTSASSANNLARLLRAGGLTMPEGCVLASIGPVTSQAMVELGWRVDAEATEATLEGLVATLVRYFGDKSSQDAGKLPVA